jgi:hypothetical protein
MASPTEAIGNSVPVTVVGPPTVASDLPTIAILAATAFGFGNRRLLPI